MAEIIELQPARDAIEGDLSGKLSMRLASLIAAAIVEDEPIRVDLMLAEMQTVARAVGMPQARFLFHGAWSAQVEIVEDIVKTAAAELDAAGAFDPSVKPLDPGKAADRPIY